MYRKKLSILQNNAVKYIGAEKFCHSASPYYNCFKIFKLTDLYLGSVVEWLRHRTDNQLGLSSKPTCAILLCHWEKHFTALSPAWWSWQAVLNYNNISTKLLADSNILASPEAGRNNFLPYV